MAAKIEVLPPDPLPIQIPGNGQPEMDPAAPKTTSVTQATFKALPPTVGSFQYDPEPMGHVQFVRKASSGYKKAITLNEREDKRLQTAMEKLMNDLQGHIGKNQTFHHLHLKHEGKKIKSAGYLFVENPDGSLRKITLHSDMPHVKELMDTWDTYCKQIDPKHEGVVSGWWSRPLGARGNGKGESTFVRKTEYTKKRQQTPADSAKAYEKSIHDDKPLSKEVRHTAMQRKAAAHALIHGLKHKLETKKKDVDSERGQNIDNTIDRLEEISTYAIDSVFDHPIISPADAPFADKLKLVDKLQERIEQSLRGTIDDTKWFAKRFNRTVDVDDEEVRNLSVDIATATPGILDDHLAYEAALKYFKVEGSKKDSLEKAIIDLSVAIVDNDADAITRALNSHVLKSTLGFLDHSADTQDVLEYLKGPLIRQIQDDLADARLAMCADGVSTADAIAQFNRGIEAIEEERNPPPQPAAP